MKPRSSSLEPPRKQNEKITGKGERTPQESHQRPTSLSLKKCKTSRSGISPSRKESSTKERRGSRSPIEGNKSNRRTRRHSTNPDRKEISRHERRRHSLSPPGKDEEETMSERRTCRRASLSPEDQDQSKHRRRRFSSSSPVRGSRNNMSRSDKVQLDQSSRKKRVKPPAEEQGQKNSRNRESLSLSERHRGSRQASSSPDWREEGESKHRRRRGSINSEGASDERHPRRAASPEGHWGGATRNSKHDEDTHFIREEESLSRRHFISPEDDKERLGEQRRRGRSAGGRGRRKERISPRGDREERNMATLVAVESRSRLMTPLPGWGPAGSDSPRHSRSQSIGHRTVGSTGHGRDESDDAVKNADNIGGRSFTRNEKTRGVRRTSSLIHFGSERNTLRNGGNKLNFGSREDVRSAGTKWRGHHAGSLGSSPKVSDGERLRDPQTSSPRRLRKHKSEDDLFYTPVHRRNKSTENIFEGSRPSSKRECSHDVARGSQNRHSPSNPRKDHDHDTGGEFSPRTRRLTIDDTSRRMSPRRGQQSLKNVHQKEQEQDLPARKKKSSLRRTSSLGRFESTKSGPHHGRSLSVDRSDPNVNGGQSSSDVPLQLRRSRMGFLDRDMAFGDSDDDDSNSGKEAEHGTRRHQQRLVDAIQQRMREQEMNEFDYYPDDDLNAENGGTENGDEGAHVDLDKIDFTALDDDEKAALFDRLEHDPLL